MTQFNPTSPTQDVPAHASKQTCRHSRHRLDDAPLRSKVALMVVTGVMVGVGIDLIASEFDGLVVLGREVSGVVAGLVCFLVVASVLILLGQWWIASPYDRLVRQIDRVADRRRPDDLGSLPLTRRDEAGRIARAMHRVTSIAIRNNHEAQTLRRTLDNRVRQATRRATVQLRRMALRDPLTDLGNRRFLDLQMEKVIDAAKQSQTDVAVVAIDMDGFKQINDTLGHDAGDELLVLLAGLLKACTRHDDLTVRLGGDEFVMLMPGCDHERAAHLSDSIRSMFNQQTRSAYPNGPSINISAGVASIRVDADPATVTGGELLKLADQRLYEAKNSGKGKTCSG